MLNYLAVSGGEEEIEKTDFQSSFMQPLPRHAFRFMQTKPGHVLAWFLSSGPQSLVILRTSSIYRVLLISCVLIYTYLQMSTLLPL